MNKNTEEATRRILDLDVKEVSLVDRAANLRQFLVIKRLQEDETMGAFVNERSNEMPKEKEFHKAEELTDEEKAKKEADETLKAEKEKKEKAKKEDEELTDEEKAKKEADEKAEKIKAEKEAEEKEAKKAKTQKDLDGVQVAIMDDGAVYVSGQPVQKAKKFTQARTDALKEMAMQLVKLIGDVDGDAMKSVMDSMKELSEEKSFTSGVKAVGTQKSLEEDVVIKELRETNTKLEKRLEELEKARMPSKSVDTDGGTDTKIVKKSLWENVL